ncbi:MAG: hypothetical protein RXQ97_04675 [Caldivirga sp.]
MKKTDQNPPCLRILPTSRVTLPLSSMSWNELTIMTRSTDPVGIDVDDASSLRNTTLSFLILPLATLRAYSSISTQ